ncbi:MAG: amidohydrolase family protein [Geminicoccaceae bacterium]
MDALLSATTVGGELMALGDECGQIREGYLADLLLVRGNPLQDVAILQHQDSFAMIIKDGAIHKMTLEGARAGQIAAE